MSLKVQPLEIPEIKIITGNKFGDERGFFAEAYNKQAFAGAGISLDFVQDNFSYSAAKFVLRGLHFQSPPFAQDKLVRVVRGRILDVAVDLRRSSPTFGKWVSAEISAKEWNQIFIPIGFAHGILTLEPETELLYKVTNFYSAKHDFGVRWNDPDIAVNWPTTETAVTLSDKDKKQPFLKDMPYLFD